MINVLVDLRFPRGTNSQSCCGDTNIIEWRRRRVGRKLVPNFLPSFVILAQALLSTQAMARDPTWNDLVDAAAKQSADQNNGTPLHKRGCQPEIRQCYDAIMVVGNDGKLTAVMVTKNMNDKIVNREICSFNDSLDIRKCANWDDGSTRRDMKDTNGNWYKVADE
jgi:hypothetical protein